MSRTPTLDPDARQRVGRDPRFLEAMAARVAAVDWRTRGECLRHDPELFFPSAAEDPEPALAICRTCRVRGACLAAALDAGECDGVWGATIPDERRAMRQVWIAPSAPA